MVMSYAMCYYDDVAAVIGGVAFILTLIFSLIGCLTNTEYVEATLSDDVAFVDVYRYYEPVSTRGEIVTFKVVGQPEEKKNDDNSQ